MIDRRRTLGAGAALLVLVTVMGCSAPESGVARGAAVWDTCSPCHGAEGQGNETFQAPSIAGLPQWYILAQFQGFEEGWRSGHPADTIGIRMRSMARSLDREGDLEAVVEYVSGLPRTQPEPTLDGDATAGAEVYANLCVACHFPSGLGLEAVGAPPIVGQHDWYMLSAYQKYLNGWRGADSTYIYAANMAEMAPTVPIDDVIDAIAYIRTLPLYEEGAD